MSEHGIWNSAAALVAFEQKSLLHEIDFANLVYAHCYLVDWVNEKL